MTGDLLLERDGSTALLTFNRPDARSTMTFEMYGDLIVSRYLSRDFHEGVRALLEKRKPDWRGC